MSIEDFYDHTVDVYRRSQDAGELRAARPGWTRQVKGSGLNARLWDTLETWVGDTGGLRQGGTYRGACPATLDVRNGDVIVPTAGPHAGQQMLVMGASKKTAPVVAHHIRLRLRAWQGSLDA